MVCRSIACGAVPRGGMVLGLLAILSVAPAGSAVASHEKSEAAPATASGGGGARAASSAAPAGRDTAAAPAGAPRPSARPRRCTRLAFSVNDYGKTGPARDARRLLDKYIARWTGERGIRRYRTGPKKVTCKLFLDFGVFDEYTCRAEASVCW